MVRVWVLDLLFTGTQDANGLQLLPQTGPGNAGLMLGYTEIKQEDVFKSLLHTKVCRKFLHVGHLTEACIREVKTCGDYETHVRPCEGPRYGILEPV